jgi:hypothetical protein
VQVPSEANLGAEVAPHGQLTGFGRVNFVSTRGSITGTISAIKLPEDAMPTYRLKAGSIRTVEGKLDDIWAKLRTNKGLIRDLAAAGYSQADIPAGQRSNLITIEAKRQGLFEIGNDVVIALAPYVALAPTAKVVLTDIWRKIVLPRLVTYLGPVPKSRGKASKGVSQTKTKKKTTKTQKKSR